CGSLMEAQNRLRPRCINTKSHNKVLTAILDAIDHQDAQIQLREVSLQQRLDLLGAGQYKSITDRRLAQAESPFPFSDGRIVSAHRQASHHPRPHLTLHLLITTK